MRFIGDFDALYLFKGDKKTTIIIILIQNATAMHSVEWMEHFFPSSLNLSSPGG